MSDTIPTVLVVDDVDMNVMILEEILKDTYHVITANNGIQALEVLHSTTTLPKIILLDIFMPEMNGYEMFENMKRDSSLRRIPVIFITTSDSETEALSTGAVDFISKPFLPEIVKLRVKNQIELKNYSDNLEAMVATKTAEMTATLDNILQSMANIIEYRNLESGSHVKRTQYLAKALIDYILDTPSAYRDELIDLKPDIIVKSVVLHDVGKIGIPDKILLKPGKLDPEEYEIMKTHTTVGRNIIEEIMKAVKDQDLMYLKHCQGIATYHHERFDGNGYPSGLAAFDIPLAARIVSLVDVYDALVCTRVYKAALAHDEAIAIIAKGKGTQFDPFLTDRVVEISNRFEEISRRIQ
ncbi:MAG: response regulator [Spirochaetaceae bacterium]|jgi:putative two-component system response regulator|nr:response regulator [Spirochaetaceae bacterium]